MGNGAGRPVIEHGSVFHSTDKIIEWMVPRETMSKQILYIDGDSWLMVQNVLQFLDENYGTFKDFIIVNAQVMANSNYDIVTRTIHNIRAPRS